MNNHTVPYDIDAERAVLGAILLDRDAILVVSDQLTPDDFYLERNALIYQAMLACLDRNTPPDLTLVTGELRKQEQLEIVGGLSYLGELMLDVPTAVHAAYYAEIVAEAATLRRLIEAGGTIVALGYNRRQELDATLEQAEQLLQTVSQRKRKTDFVPLGAIVQQYFEHAEHPETNQVVPTGISGLDERLNGGLRPGQLALLAARPGVGKSGMALSIAYTLGVKLGRNVGVVSLEMGSDELVERFIAMHTGIDTRQVEHHMRRGDLRVIAALAILSQASIFIEDSSMLNVTDVRAKARRLAATQPLDLLIVDYLQLLVGDAHAKSRVDEVSRISRQLKLLARELKCPILALSQLSRSVEMRASKVPQLSDLRDSGALEQDADIVVFIHRSELYEGAAGRKGTTELHIAKQRNGPLGVVAVQFDAPTTSFRSPDGCDMLMAS